MLVGAVNAGAFGETMSGASICELSVSTRVGSQLLPGQACARRCRMSDTAVCVTARPIRREYAYPEMNSPEAKEILMRKHVGSIAAGALLFLAGCGATDPVVAFEKDVQVITGATLEEFLGGEDQDKAFHLMCEVLGNDRMDFSTLVRSRYRITTQKTTELSESLQKNICDNEVWAATAPQQGTSESTEQSAAAPAQTTATPAAPTTRAEAEETALGA